MEERICELCGKKFMTNYPRKKTCSAECSRALDGRRCRKSIIADRVAEAENKLTKTLSDWTREARECNMTYGQYRAQIEVFGKTYEELKATADTRATMAHAHANKDSHNSTDSGYVYKLA